MAVGSSSIIPPSSFSAIKSYRDGAVLGASNRVKQIKTSFTSDIQIMINALEKLEKLIYINIGDYNTVRPDLEEVSKNFNLEIFFKTCKIDNIRDKCFFLARVLRIKQLFIYMGNSYEKLYTSLKSIFSLNTIAANPNNKPLTYIL
jgi:hypothetical protein